MLLAEAASVPRMDLSQKDEAMRYGRNGSWVPVGGKILDSSKQRESYTLDL